VTGERQPNMKRTDGDSTTEHDTEGDDEQHEHNEDGDGTDAIRTTDASLSPGDEQSPAASEQYCHSCGSVIKREAVICPQCGVRQSQSAASDHNTTTSPVVAGLVSLIIPGAGMLFVGAPLKDRGAVWLGGAIVAAFLLSVFTVITFGLGGILWLGWPIVHILAAADSYIQADKIYEV